MMAESQFDVFLCHNSEDKPAVIKIAQQLQQSGVKPWLDTWELRPGVDWQEVLETQIQQIDCVAVFVGKTGIGPWQEREMRAYIRAFVRRRSPVIPVLLPSAPQVPKLPMLLEDFHWVDFRQAEPNPLRQLIWGITGERPRQPEADKQSPKAPILRYPSIKESREVDGLGKEWSESHLRNEKSESISRPSKLESLELLESRGLTPLQRKGSRESMLWQMLSFSLVLYGCQGYFITGAWAWAWALSLGLTGAFAGARTGTWPLGLAGTLAGVGAWTLAGTFALAGAWTLARAWVSALNWSWASWVLALFWAWSWAGFLLATTEMLHESFQPRQIFMILLCTAMTGLAIGGLVGYLMQNI